MAQPKRRDQAGQIGQRARDRPGIPAQPGGLRLGLVPLGLVGPVEPGSQVVTTGMSQLAEGTPVIIRQPQEQASVAPAESTEVAAEAEIEPVAEGRPEPDATTEETERP